jgi:hypothetical protein
MSDDTTTHGPTLRKTEQSVISSIPSAQEQPISVVLVEPHRDDLHGRASLLANTLYQVTTVKGIYELIMLRDKESFELALLSVLLGDSHLVAAARTVRSQWPRARIIVLGQAAPVLDDHLYDEALSYTCEQQVLLDTLERLTHYPWAEKPSGRPFIVPSATSEHVPIQQSHLAVKATAGSSDATQDLAGTEAKG